MTTVDTAPGTSGRELAREVLVHGPIARAELARRLRLSPASLTRLSKPFLERGLFIEGPERSDGVVGRPAKPLDVRVDAQRFVGIKLTGERAFGVATDLRARVLSTADIDLAGHDPRQVAAGVESLVAGFAAHGQALSGVGVSIGGKVTGSTVVDRAPFLDWRGVDLGALLTRQLGLPVIMENDVVALTEFEHWFGRARGLDNFAVITTGAGVGYGLVMHGRQVITPDTGLGLGGHFPLDPTGPVCAQGHRGCSTAMLSAPSMCAWAGIGLGRDVGYEELLSLAREGHPVAQQVVGTAGRALGRMIAAVANLTMVNSVVLSGEGIGIMSVPVASEGILKELSADRDPDAETVSLLVGDPDFGAWARGAAAVAIQARFADMDA